MPRLRNAAGVVVTVSDDTASRLGSGWVSAGEAQTLSADTPTGYQDMTVEDLKDKIRVRNEDRDEDERIPLSGSKSDLIAALTTDD